MRRSYKYRLYPNRVQAAALDEQRETHRRLYNAALEERKVAWEAEQRSVRYGEQSAAFKLARHENDFYSRLNFSSAQATLRKLNLAYEAFFRRVKAGEAAGYPRFKGRSRYKSICYPSYGDGCKMRPNGRLYLQNVGEIKVKRHREWEGEIKTVTVIKQADRWFVVLSCDLGDVEVAPSTNPPVGIDLGLKAFYVTSEGESVAPPQHHRKGQKQLRRLQRRVSRRTKGSARWRKACRAVAHFHWRIANRRRDFHFKQAHDLVTRYGAVYAEDLNIRGIARTRLAKSTYDVAWGSFLSILEHKAECAGVRFGRVDPRYTTQTCSRCGALPLFKITLRDRTYSCGSCGFAADRDENAALNVLARGLGCSLQATSVPVGALA